MKKNVIFSVINQGTVSAFQFVITIYMVKSWTPELFGIYSIVFAIGLTLAGIQNSLVITPYSVMVHRSEYSSTWNDINCAISTMNGYIVVFVILLTFSSVVLMDHGLCFAGICSFYFASVLIKEYQKGIVVIEGKVKSLAIKEGLVTLFSVLIIAVFMWQSEVQVALNFMLLIISISNLTIALTLGYGIDKKEDINVKTGFDLYKKSVWLDSKWSLLGMVSTELQNKGYLYIVTIVSGPALVALLQAGRVLLGPLNLFVSAWGRVARPKLASLISSGDQKGLNKIINTSVFLFLVFDLIFFMIIFLFWDVIEKTIFSAQYADVFQVTLLWAGVTLIFHIRSVYSILCQSYMYFKKLSYATIYGAIVALIFVMLIVGIIGNYMVILGVLCGEVVALVYIIVFVLRLQKNENIK